jgi:hypothetical protein
MSVCTIKGFSGHDLSDRRIGFGCHLFISKKEGEIRGDHLDKKITFVTL